MLLSDCVFLKEVTKWDKVDYNQPNHTYIMKGSYCIGYIKEGCTEKTIFKSPLKKFDKRYRKFKDVSKEYR